MHELENKGTMYICISQGLFKGPSMLLKPSRHLQFMWLTAFLSWVCIAECLAEAVLSKI